MQSLGIPKATLTSDTNCKLWGPKTTLQFHTSLEVCTELSKAIILMVMVSYSKRIQIKITQGRRHKGQRPRDNKCRVSSHLLPVELCGQCLPLLVIVWQHTWYCQVGKLFQALAYTFYLGWVTYMCAFPASPQVRD